MSVRGLSSDLDPTLNLLRQGRSKLLNMGEIFTCIK